MNKKYLIILMSILLIGLVQACHCGDGFVNQPWEECDDGNNENNDGCSSMCKIEGEPECYIDSDCGIDYCAGEPNYCGQDGNVYQAFVVYTCNNPGEPDAYCSNDIIPWLLDTCDCGCEQGSCITECPVEPVCGNEIIEEGEECDDGNDEDEDGCRNDCTLPYCGDLILDECYEECDDGNDEDGDGCRNDCTLPYCGDLILDECEQCEVDSDCDDEDELTTDTCSSCVCEYEEIPYCGDGIKDSGEECDDGNNDNDDGCDEYCEIEEEPYCGDGVCSGEEDCETCEDDCGECSIEEECGNEITEEGEQCDNGELNGIECDNSTSSCTYCSSECELITLNYSDDEDDKKSKSSSSRKTYLVSFCEPNWKCSGWSECYESMMFRECKDINYCEYVYNKPIETTGCSMISKALVEDKKPFNWLFILFIITFILFIILIILLILKNRNL